MNFNIYLDRDSAERLDRLAHKRRTPRNALVREAVRVLIDRSTAAWPKEVLEFKGEPSLAPFESHRVELASDRDDPFEPPAQPRRRLRHRSR
jgi:hypothetical protein